MKKRSYEPADVEKAQAGDKRAMERLVRGMEGMAHYVAKRFAGRTHLDVEELVQEARVAVLRAVRRFNPNKGMAFHNYCLQWMQALVRRLTITENPSDRRNVGGRVALGKSSRRREAGNIWPTHHSLDEPVRNLAGRESNQTLADTLVSDTAHPEAIVAALDMRDKAAHLIRDRLRGVDSHVMRERAAGKTLDSIGSDLDFSRERIRQIEKRAVKKLQHSARLRGYVQ